MSTLGEVRQLIHRFVLNRELWGMTAEFESGFQAWVRDIGAAICEEHKMDGEQATNLPDDTLLGEKSQPLFDQLKQWLLERKDVGAPQPSA